jgi:trans-aconitate methyltransferase
VDLREKNKRDEVQLFQHPWELARLDAVIDYLERNKIISNAKNLLDMGCGDTFFLESLAVRFPKINYVGVDINFDDDYLSDKKESLPSNIQLYKSLETAEIDFPDIRFDVVLLLDVIEHIEDDIEFMKYMKSKTCITSKTMFCITVPAYQALFCSHDVFLGHFRRYTNKMLKRHLSQSGYEVLEVQYFFSILILPRLIQVMKEKIAKPQDSTTGLVEWNGGKSKTDFISLILFSDYKLNRFLKRLGIGLPGLSNIATCQIDA